jgi:peptidoglycan/LPS O-acetylase OafA/YrhL
VSSTGAAVHGTEVPPVVAPPPGNPRFPLFDGLRAIAALSILTAHAAFASGAIALAWYGGLADQLHIGVTIFFLISGFLLYRPFFAARFEGRRPPRVRDYARRRLLRIVPAYWLALTLLAIWPGLDGVFSGDWWIFYGFLQIYSPNTVLQGMGQAWSLCIEISFYLLLPLFALAMARLNGPDRRERMVRVELGTLAGLAVACLATRTVEQAAGGGTIIPYTLLGTFDWFALGMGLAVLSVWVESLPRVPRPVELVTRNPGACWAAALAIFLYLGFGLGLEREYPPRYTDTQWFLEHLLSGLASLFLLLPAVFGGAAGGLPRRVLAWRPLAWLGLISYGIYLWQQEVINFLFEHKVQDWIPGSGFMVMGSMAFVITVTIAALSYYLVERPILRFKDRGRRRPVNPRTPLPVDPARDAARQAG